MKHLVTVPLCSISFLSFVGENDSTWRLERAIFHSPPTTSPRSYNTSVSAERLGGGRAMTFNIIFQYTPKMDQHGKTITGLFNGYDLVSL